jgi:hypothetical protein
MHCKPLLILTLDWGYDYMPACTMHRLLCEAVLHRIHCFAGEHVQEVYKCAIGGNCAYRLGLAEGNASSQSKFHPARTHPGRPLALQRQLLLPPLPAVGVAHHLHLHLHQARGAHLRPCHPALHPAAQHHLCCHCRHRHCSRPRRSQLHCGHGLQVHHPVLVLTLHLKQRVMHQVG